MKTVGRIIVREGKTVGLFVPFGDSLKPGLYDVREILGEITLEYLGTPVLDNTKLQGVSVEQLVQNPEALMTPKEYKEVC